MIKKCSAMLMAVCLFAQMSFGDVWQDLAKYKYGEGNVADEAHSLLQKTPVDQHGAIEDSLIAVVSSKDATQDGKAFACRMLQQIGTAKCIPALAELLSDEVLSHYALLVLERMGNPKADEAMRTALDKAPDKAKVGILGSLGVRRDAEAVKQVEKLVANGDQAVASAAISALGRIGGQAAAKCLSALKPAESLKSVHMIALLDCARSLQGAEAVSLYELVLAGKTTHRIGALSGMLAADEKKAVALMVDFLKGDDGQIPGGVLTIVCGEKSELLTKAMADLLGKLPDEKKISLVTALGARGDRAALDGIAASLASTNDKLRNAAVMAVSKIGDDSAVKLLLGMSGGATDAITKMGGSGVNEALVKALADNKLKVPAIKAITSRNYVAAVPVLINMLKDSEAEVRKAAWSAIGSIATEAYVGPLAKAAFAIKDEAELASGVAAVRNLCAHAEDKVKCFDEIASCYDAAPDSAKSSVIELASAIGSPSALGVIKKALKSGNKEIYSKALRSLTTWSNESAADELAVLAKNAPEEVDRILAIRRYIEIAGMDNVKLSTDQRADMLKKAADIVTRPDEKKLIIGSLQKAKNAVTLGIVNKFIDDPALREESEQFAVVIVEQLRKDGPADAVKQLANKLLTSKNQDRVNKAKNVLENIGK